jgi:SAM-dependent methyltransferase
MRMLRSMCRDYVVGLDISRGMLSVARQRLGELPGNPRLALVRGDALDLPFGPVFDLVVCFGALGHILKADQRQFMTEVAGVLRPGGRFVFVTSYMPPLLSKRYWLSRCFNAAMHLRNALVSPPFVMYYLTFLLPDVQRLLEQCGLTVEVQRLGVAAGQREEFRLVIATRDILPRPSRNRSETGGPKGDGRESVRVVREDDRHSRRRAVRRHAVDDGPPSFEAPAGPVLQGAVRTAPA